MRKEEKEKMKSDKKLFYLIEALLLLAFLFMVIIVMQDNARSEKIKIAVIVRDSNSGQWSAVKYGMKMAAKDTNAELIFVSTSDISSSDELNELVQNELEAKSDGVIVQELFGQAQERELATAGVPSVILGRSAQDRGEGGLSRAYGNFDKMMQAIADEVLADYNNDLKDKKIGLVFEKSTAKDEAQAIEALRRTLRDKGAHMYWEADNISADDDRSRLYNESKADIVIALDDRGLSLAGDANAHNDLHGARVYGIGYSMENIYYVDSKDVDCIIVPDYFRLGYESFRLAAKKVRHRFSNVQDVEVGYSVIRQKTLFTEENQNIIYSMSR